MNLIEACYNNNLDMIKILLDKGADVDVKDNNGETPLLWACYNNTLDMVKLLISKDADVNVKNNNGETPLLWACYNNTLDMVKILLDNNYIFIKEDLVIFKMGGVDKNILHLILSLIIKPNNINILMKI